MKIKLSKISVAASHLRWAVKLFFLRCDPPVIETLVGAASGVLRGIAKQRGVQAFLHDSDLIKPEYKGFWIKTLHKPQNFFKHSDKDADEVLEYEPKGVQFILLEACSLYRHLASDKHLGHQQCKEALLYELWFALAHPDLIMDLEEYERFLKLFGLMGIKDIDPDDFEMFQDILDKG
jgi:hypothetical protein